MSIFGSTVALVNIPPLSGIEVALQGLILLAAILAVASRFVGANTSTSGRPGERREKRLPDFCLLMLMALCTMGAARLLLALHPTPLNSVSGSLTHLLLLVSYPLFMLAALKFPTP